MARPTGRPTGRPPAPSLPDDAAAALRALRAAAPPHPGVSAPTVQRRRFLTYAVALLDEGWPYVSLARATGVNPTMPSQWRKRGEDVTAVSIQGLPLPTCPRGAR